MNNKKQTAVDWYISKIKEARNLCYDASMEMDIGHTLEVLIKKGEQAKEMEKEQMRSYIEEKWKQYRIVTNEEDAWLFKEWLIKQTYGGNK